MSFCSPQRSRLPVPNHVLLGMVILCILAFGLHPKGLTFRNDVRRDVDGIRFGEYGIAFTQPFLTGAQAEELGATGFAIEAAFTLPQPPADGFNTIVLIYNGEARSQFLIGQWQRQLIVMNGDDYDYRRRTPRLVVDTSHIESDSLFLTLSVGGAERETVLFINGVPEKTSETITLRLPRGGEPSRVVLGNSARGADSFEGGLFRFSLYDSPLEQETVSHHYAQWRERQDGLPDTPALPLLAYRFDKNQANALEGTHDPQVRLEIPEFRTALDRRVLAFPAVSNRIRADMVLDIFLNLVGFMPFGFLATIAVYNRRRGRFGTLFLVVTAGILLSLGIEVTQSWMPSRDSSLLDLILNTVGAAAGSVLAFGVAWYPTSFGISRWETPPKDLPPQNSRET